MPITLSDFGLSDPVSTLLNSAHTCHDRQRRKWLRIGDFLVVMACSLAKRSQPRTEKKISYIVAYPETKEEVLLDIQP
jgi:hypothetical protein